MKQGVLQALFEGVVKGAGFSFAAFVVTGFVLVASGLSSALPNVTGGQTLSATAWNDMVNKINSIEASKAPTLVYSGSYTTTSGTDTVTLTKTGMIYAEAWAHDVSDGDASIAITINGIYCARDRMVSGATTNGYAQGSCSRIVPAGTYAIMTSANGATGRGRIVWAIEY